MVIELTIQLNCDIHYRMSRQLHKEIRPSQLHQLDFSEHSLVRKVATIPLLDHICKRKRKICILMLISNPQLN